MIDVVRTAGEAEVALVAKGDIDGTLKVSMRSKGQVDVGAICVGLGGGGHLFAAGFTSYDDVPTTVARVTAALALAPAPDRVSQPTPTARAGWSSSTSPAAGRRSTSVARMRRLAGTRRVGHAGTLDPMATGVLVDRHQQGHPAARSPRPDQQGLPRARSGSARPPTPTTPRASCSSPSDAVDGLDESAIVQALQAFRGQIEQVPPQISAIKVDGKRSYARARAGETVELAARTVTVSRLELDGAPPAAGRPSTSTS